MDKTARIVLLALACAAWGLAGCFSLDRASFFRTNEEHVLVSNYGWYLFHYFPLACGNASKDRWLPWVMFRNDVQMDKIQARFMDYAGPRHVRNLTYTTYDSVMLEIPGLNLPLPIPYLLTYREIQLSGVLEDPSEDKDLEKGSEP